MNQTLDRCEISFHTNDDDKDGDTHVTVTVRGPNGEVVARRDDDFGSFDDNSDAGPYEVFLDNEGGEFPESKAGLSVQGGNVTIRIDPNGDDTWKFRFFLSMQFSNGQTLNSNWSQDFEMNEDDRERTVQLVDLFPGGE